MTKIDDIVAQMKRNPNSVRFTDLSKAYQVKQVLLALEKLEVSRGAKK